MNVRNSRTIFLVMLLGLLTACASAPQAPQSATSGKTAAAAALPSDGQPVPPGFKFTVRNGAEYFCQSRKLTGSRTRTTEVCFTRDDLLRMDQLTNQYWKNAGVSGSQSQIEMAPPN